jgi:hypothetical protein
LVANHNHINDIRVDPKAQVGQDIDDLPAEIWMAAKGANGVLSATWVKDLVV